MSLREVFTKQRSGERWIFGLIGASALLYALVQVSRAQLGVAAFLAASGVAALLAATLCSERTLRAAGVAAILVNVAAAALSLLAPR